MQHSTASVGLANQRLDHVRCAIFGHKCWIRAVLGHSHSTRSLTALPDGRGMREGGEGGGGRRRREVERLVLQVWNLYTSVKVTLHSPSFLSPIIITLP